MLWQEEQPPANFVLAENLLQAQERIWDQECILLGRNKCNSANPSKEKKTYTFKKKKHMQA